LKTRLIVSRKESGSPLGLEPDDFARCLEVVSSLTLYSHEFLLKVNNELDLFKGFMAWLRHGLDQLITVINIDEKQNEDPQIDTLKVTEYIECFVRQSSLQSFFGRNAEPKLSSFKERGENITEIYMDTGKFSVIPGFMELAEYLESLCETVFSKPQQSMREQVRMGVPILLTPYFIHNRDMKMVYIDEKPVACIAFHHNHGFGSACKLEFY
jgi:anaphase-promoting complex subunit 4